MMNINRAVSVLAKKFTVNAELFKSLSKESVIRWAEAVVAGTENDKRNQTENSYKLTRHQHAFLVGDLNFVPMVGRYYEF
jgi:hypothetical protein